MLKHIYETTPESNGHALAAGEETSHLPKMSHTRLPEEIYRLLPPYLADACGVFTDAIEKDVFLLGALTVISGCLPNVYGTYDGRRVGTNIYVFIIAPASAGKGSLVWAKDLAGPIHEHKRGLSELGQQKMLLIPGNNSSSGFIEVLANNEEKGILFCTEADTLSGTLSQDWGNYSELLRAAFHHEDYSMMRKSSQEYYDLKNPHLSILLSGTPGQLSKLIPNAENGLFSRFAFYTFDIVPKMRDVFAASTVDYAAHIEVCGKKLFRFHERMEQLTDAVRFDFTSGQKTHFLSLFDKWHREFRFTLGNNSIASIRRLGLIHFRLSMVLSLLRYMDADSIPATIQCEEQDYLTAMRMIEVLKSNAALLFTQLKQSDSKHSFDGSKLQLYQALPDGIFNRADALSLASSIGMARPTFDRFLKSEAFVKEGYGKYRKTR